MPLQVFCPEAVRASMLAMYDGCPRKFLYVHRFRLRPKARKINQPMRAGSLFHAAVQELYRDDCTLDTAFTRVYVQHVQPVLEQLHLEADEDVTGVKEEAATILERAWEMARAMVSIFWSRYPLDRTRYEVVAVERLIQKDAAAFAELTPRVQIRGTPDIILRDKKSGSLWLPDHKTTGRDPAQAIIGRQWAWQTRLYRLLVTLEYDETPLGIIYNFIRRPTIRYCPTTKDKGGFESYIDRCRDGYEKKGEKAAVSYALLCSEPLMPAVLTNALFTVGMACSWGYVPGMSQEDIDIAFLRRFQSGAGCGRCPFSPLCESDAAAWEPLAESLYTVRTEKEEDET